MRDATVPSVSSSNGAAAWMNRTEQSRSHAMRAFYIFSTIIIIAERYDDAMKIRGMSNRSFQTKRQHAQCAQFVLLQRVSIDASEWSIFIRFGLVLSFQCAFVTLGTPFLLRSALVCSLFFLSLSLLPREFLRLVNIGCRASINRWDSTQHQRQQSIWPKLNWNRCYTVSMHAEYARTTCVFIIDAFESNPELRFSWISTRIYFELKVRFFCANK